jgi:hypothetical protein
LEGAQSPYLKENAMSISSPPLDASTLRQLANFTGWHSAQDAAWSAAGDSYEGRSAVKKCLGDLFRSHEIERIYVQHNNEPLLCYYIDGQRLQALAEAAEQ